MARDAKPTARTPGQALSDSMGGRLALAGFVYQLLSGLAAGMRMVVADVQRAQGDVVAARLTLEPPDGGDQQRHQGRQRVVEQLKIRTSGKAWTSGEIAELVLPDLLRAARTAKADIDTVYQFTTNGAVDCASLLALAAALIGREPPQDPLQALDDVAKSYPYGARLTQRAFFARLAARAETEDFGALWRVLAGLKIQGEATESGLIQQIDTVLHTVLDHQEAAEAKRHELISRLADLAIDGQTIIVDAFLRMADVHLTRLLHLGQLSAQLDTQVRRQAHAIGYDPAKDVRACPPLDPGVAVTLVRGASGYGKSWTLGAMALRDVAAGRLALLAANVRSIEDIRRLIVEQTWLSSYDAQVELPVLARRIGPRFVDAHGFWLTVFIDDVQDLGLANQVLAYDWAARGVRLVLSSRTDLIDELLGRNPAAELITVQRFSPAELNRLLEGHGRKGALLPADVFELLRTPIFAKLYLGVDTTGWRPANEYSLMDRYWTQATAAGLMAEHQDDLVDLRALALSLLGPSPLYPWPTAVAKAHGVTDPVRGRLQKAGVLQRLTAGSQIVHDRILNWLVADALAERLSLGQATTGDLQVELEKLAGKGDLPAPLSRRLGYVLMDLLWILARSQPPQVVADLIDNVIADWQGRSATDRFIQDDLAGLGAPLLPALEAMIESAAKQDQQSGRLASLGRAIGEIAKLNPQSATPVVERLLAGAPTLRAGLEACIRQSFPSLLDRLWSIHIGREQACDVAEAADWTSSESRSLRALTRVTFAATARAAATRADWFGPMIDQAKTTVEVEQLLYLLLTLDVEAGAKVWRTYKTAILAKIRPGTHAVARAIARFSDLQELDRLEVTTEDADGAEPALRLLALVRLAPARAVALLGLLDDNQLGPTTGMWLRRIIRAAPDATAAALLAKHQAGGWQGLRDLALIFNGASDLVDGAVFKAVLDALEARLVEVDGDDTWSPRGETHLLRFIAQAGRPEHLALLASRAGQSLDQLLASRAVRHQARQSLSEDREGGLYLRTLMSIGGPGVLRQVLHEIGDPSPFARLDGYRHALYLPPSDALTRALAARAQAPGPDGRPDHEDGALGLALAAQGADEALVAHAYRTATWSRAGIDLRAQMGPMAPDLMDRLRADVVSNDPVQRDGAIAALAYVPAADALEPLSQALDQMNPAGRGAAWIVETLAHRRIYTPLALARLKAMLTGPHLRLVTRYLAYLGDAEARSAIALLLAAPGELSQNDVLDVALVLADHPETAEAALPILEAAFGQFWSRRDFSEIGQRLLVAGRIATHRLVEALHAQDELHPAALVELLEQLRADAPDEAIVIAERRFTATPSWPLAKFLISQDRPGGIDFLIDHALSDPRSSVLGIIGRGLRRLGDRAALGHRLEGVARTGDGAVRGVVAALCGWQTDAGLTDLLAAIAEEADEQVAKIAVEAIERRDRETQGAALLQAVSGADHLGRWSHLLALIDMVDPGLLTEEGGPLHIEPVLRALPPVYRVGVEVVVAKREDDIAKEEKRDDDRSREPY
ncbi:hypothetical protein BH10PSE4_BH10PSE4_30080 [soil metagenome]